MNVEQSWAKHRFWSSRYHGYCGSETVRSRFPPSRPGFESLKRQRHFNFGYSNSKYVNLYKLGIQTQVIWTTPLSDHFTHPLERMLQRYRYRVWSRVPLVYRLLFIICISSNHSATAPPSRTLWCQFAFLTKFQQIAKEAQNENLIPSKSFCCKKLKRKKIINAKKNNLHFCKFFISFVAKL